MSKNNNLHKAKTAKNDEFYTLFMRELLLKKEDEKHARRRTNKINKNV